MSLVERITQALNGTSAMPWQNVGGRVSDAEGYEVAVVDYLYGGESHQLADARLIAAAPGLLAECAQRLDPGDVDVAEVIEQVRFVGQWDASHLLTVAADLLEQVFLDPQETNQ